MLKIAVCFLIIVLVILGVCAFAIFNAGIGSVYIQNDSVSLWLPIPMVAVDMALRFCPVDELNEIQRHITPIKDIAVAAAGTIEDCPDATFLEAYDHGESVRIDKTGNVLSIAVSSATEGKVRVKLPIHSLNRILRAALKSKS